MSSTVDDVHHWNWHFVSLPSRPLNVDLLDIKLALLQFSDVLEELEAKGFCSSTTHSHGHCQDGIGSQFGLGIAPIVLCSVQLLNHEVIQLLLESDIFALQLWRNDAVNVLHRLGNPSSFVAAATISELQSLINSSGGSTGHNCAEGSIACGQLCFHCWIPSAVNHLSANKADDLRFVVCWQFLAGFLAKAGRRPLPREPKQRKGHEGSNHRSFIFAPICHTELEKFGRGGS
mmetsp:Transcript_18334/g.31042  ORF Transcript_18334/g.31042 Transcript_18334/m.31042 type:complete len:232 (-) Transcript_18334:22-717(-)